MAGIRAPCWKGMRLLWPEQLTHPVCSLSCLQERQLWEPILGDVEETYSQTQAGEGRSDGRILTCPPYSHSANVTLVQTPFSLIGNLHGSPSGTCGPSPSSPKSKQQLQDTSQTHHLSPGKPKGSLNGTLVPSLTLSRVLPQGDGQHFLCPSKTLLHKKSSSLLSCVRLRFLHLTQLSPPS